VAQTVEQVPKKYEVLQYHKEAKKKNRKWAKGSKRTKEYTEITKRHTYYILIIR
jgi:hypothetical protein